MKVKINEKPKKSIGNPFAQVSMAVLRIWGRYTSYVTNITDKEIPLESDK